MAYRAERFILMLQTNHKKTRILASIFVTIIFGGFSLVIALNRQYISDQITVWQFQPTSEITGLVDRAGMNDSGKFIYLASKPELNSPTDFNVACDRIENTTSILGCFSDRKIYLYNVTDPQLDGIREVTAVHETLHAVYLRLSATEKDRVNVLLENEYAKLENNEDFKSLMEFYDRTEPGQRDNELHSIIGTEVSNIGHELESYYSKYFTDRSKVVALDDKYSSVFNDLSTRASDLATRLNALGITISSNTEKYNSDARMLNSDISSFNIRADNGSFSSQHSFDLERSALTSRVSALEKLRTTLTTDISEYEAKLSEYNSISSQTKKLYDSIDSTLVSAPSV